MEKGGKEDDPKQNDPKQDQAPHRDNTKDKPEWLPSKEVHHQPHSGP